MRKLLLIWMAMLALGYICVLPCQAQPTLEGDWTGGIDFGREWQSVRFSFKSEGATIKGILDFPQQNRIGLALNRVVFESPHLRIEWRGQAALAVFYGVV